jgi:hypothetical protein
VKVRPGPASKLFEVAVHDDAEAAVVTGALFHSVEWIVEGVAVVAENERQSAPIELRTQTADIGELVQGGRQGLRKVLLRIAGVAGARWAKVRKPEKRQQAERRRR